MVQLAPRNPTPRNMRAAVAGGVDKRSLEIEMNSVLGGVPELSTISSSEPIALAAIVSQYNKGANDWYIYEGDFSSRIWPPLQSRQWLE